MNRRLCLLAAAAGPAWALALGGCAALPRPPAAPDHWSGRLAVSVEGEPGQSFTASFDLRGSAREGELRLLTPLGSTAADLRWTPAGARLQAPGQAERSAPTLDELVRQAMGAEVPVAALFDWLAGTPTEAAGWQADLSGRDAGRLQARRLSPPRASLRVILDTP